MAIIIQGKEQFYKDLAAFLERQIQSEIETISHYRNLIADIESSTFWSDDEKARMIAAAQGVALAAQRRLEKQRETLSHIKGGEKKPESNTSSSPPILPPLIPSAGGGTSAINIGSDGSIDQSDSQGGSWLILAVGVMAFFLILVILRN